MIVLIAGNWQRGAGRIARYGSVGGRGTRAMQGRTAAPGRAASAVMQGPAAAQRRGLMTSIGQPLA